MAYVYPRVDFGLDGAYGCIPLQGPVSTYGLTVSSVAGAGVRH